MREQLGIVAEPASTRLNVLLVNSYFHPAAGGVENYLLNVGRELLALGHNVTVVTSRCNPALPLRDAVDGITVLRYQVAIFDAPLGLANKQLRIRACRQRLMALLKEVRFDVAWVRDLESLAAVMTIARRPPVLFIQAVAYGIFHRAIREPARSRRWRHLAYRALEHAWIVGVGVWLERRLLPRCEGRVVLSRAKRTEISAAYGLDPGTFRVIPAGIDTSRFSPAEPSERRSIRHSLGLPAEAFLFLYVGRFTREKNPLGLLEAFVRMRPASEVTLAMVGPAPDDFRERVAAVSSTAPGPIRLVGEVHAPADWYRAADAFVLPSLTEGFGQVLLEAMASRLPVVAYRSPQGSPVLATEEIVTDGETGVLASYDDTEDLAKVMTRLANNPVMARQMGDSGLRHCRRTYSWRSVTERLISETARIRGATRRV